MGIRKIQELDTLINELELTKTNLKTSIENKGVIVGDVKMEEYPSKIDSINTQKPEVKLTQTIVENGTKTFSPLAGSVYSSAELTVEVPATPTQEKNIDITENKVTEITPDPNFNLSKVTVTTNIPQPTLEENKTQEIVTNGQTVIAPSGGNDAMKQVTLNVNVPEKTFKTQTKTENVTENKTISVIPDDGYDGLTKVDVTVNVNVPKIEETKSVTLTSNGTSNVGPSSGFDAIKNVEVTVNVPSDIKPEVKLTQTIVENGTKTFNPPTGYVYSSAELTVEVPATPTQEKAVQITENKVTEITPDPNFNLSKVTVTTNIPQPTLEENKTQEIVTNGQTVIAPTEGNDAMKQVTLNVNVPEKTFKTQTKTETVTENKTISVIPDEGYDGLTKVDVTVNVPTSGYVWNPGDNIFTSYNADYEYPATIIDMLYVTPTLAECTMPDGSVTNLLESDGNIKIRTTGMYKIRLSVTGNSLNNLFYGSQLRTLPDINTSQITNFKDLAVGAEIIEIPNYDFSNAVTLESAFTECKNLSIIRNMNTSKCTKFNDCFRGIPYIREIQGIDFSSVKDPNNIRYFFATGYQGRQTSVNKFILNGKLSMSYPKSVNLLSNCADTLSYNTIKSWLTAASKTTNSMGKELDFSKFGGGARTIQDKDGELAALVEACSDPSKNWTIKNLTIQ